MRNGNVSGPGGGGGVRSGVKDSSALSDEIIGGFEGEDPPTENKIMRNIKIIVGIRMRANVRRPAN